MFHWFAVLSGVIISRRGASCLGTFTSKNPAYDFWRITSTLSEFAAFDTVDHNILLQRLHSKFSVRGKALDWFASYLADRTQSVVINNTKSKPYPLECGVPQGSILGPILYLLCTSTLADILKHHNMCYHLYADDIQMYVSFAIIMMTIL